MRGVRGGRQVDFLFQHTAARRRLGAAKSWRFWSKWFQHTAARRRLAPHPDRRPAHLLFQHTAARRRLGLFGWRSVIRRGFNTQPPEGGWPVGKIQGRCRSRFQHTAARRRLDRTCSADPMMAFVSTHSRPKAAGNPERLYPSIISRFNTQPPEGGWVIAKGAVVHRGEFQHTAARRRLGAGAARGGHRFAVSTHSRPKAAGGQRCVRTLPGDVSTHSRPKAAGKRGC